MRQPRPVHHPGGTTTYGYDALDRLQSEAGPAATQSFTYDANDNRLADGTGAKTYLPNSDRIVTENGQTITLDAAGNVTSARGLSFTWNQAGQLKSIRQGSTLLATYTYDYKGRRSRKVVYFGTWGVTTIYAYDRYDRLTAELGATGTPLRTYVWRDDVPVGLILHGAQDSVLYLETDHLGTPIVARDPAGTVVWRWESDAFGTTPPNEDPDGDGVRTTINLRFPGQYFDRESGLHYNWHRYYDPKLGSYLSPDPIGLAGGINLYSYVGSNPLSSVDPFGLSKFDKTYGLPKEFWNWYHRKHKKPGDPDLEKEEAKELCEQWKKDGRPKPDNKQRGSADQDLLDWLLPWWLYSGDAC